jgi:hypothetical protein
MVSYVRYLQLVARYDMCCGPDAFGWRAVQVGDLWMLVVAASKDWCGDLGAHGG